MSGDFSKMIEFMTLIGQLKRVQRTGWVRSNITRPESVADHMYRMAILAFLVDPASGLDKDRCIKLALVHDMAESMVGDIAPSDGISKEEKHKKEEAAMGYISSLVESSVGREIYCLWKEYEDQSSAEAAYVKDLDKFEMILQAYEYEQLEDKPKCLEEFFASTKGKFQTDQVKQWVESLESVRSNPKTS
ncbi:5'-deoxynucleotidase HDDC2-like [Gigantopelta aegis]|uniref:5'-deoxynucleotidase HDDC2-like n=1 Tax=Gigantopelta aegis TaxID=1735272 RepID=UPI001B88BE12|nr:5'-deoxynucleotidase HDDC2-like [Gigantopelta aegis]